jgi:hypothetical protein
VAQIEMRPDNESTRLWWLYWAERNELIGQIEDRGGHCTVIPHGPHWSPMKSFGRVFDNPSSAHLEVQRYFERR